MSETMKTVMDILMDIDDTIDYETEKNLIGDRILDSFAIISLVGGLEAEFDIRINAVEMVPENFNSVEQIAQMVERLS